MTRRLLAGFLITALVVLIAHDVPLSISLNRADHDATVVALRHDATLIGALAEETLEGRAGGNLDLVAARYRERTGNDAVIFDGSGQPVGRATNDQADVAGIARLEGVALALAGQQTFRNLRGPAGYSADAVIVPVLSGERVRGAVYVAAPTSRRDGARTRRWLGLAGSSLITLAAVAVIGALVARSLNRPLADLHRATLRFAAGDLAAAAGVHRGPPAVRDLARAFNDMTIRTRTALETQRGFAADASHQLRTPLTAIKLRLDQLNRHLPAADPDAERILDAAKDETERLHRMIEGLLALARADANTSTEVVDIARIAQERRDLWAPLAEEKGVDLSIDVPERLLGSAVPGAVEQIIDNYLANALEVAPERSIVTITARATSADFAEIRISDRGTGMAPDQLTNVFDRFWRAPNASHNGTGLGLSIVARLAHASGGTVELRNAPTGGLDAIASLPLGGSPGQVSGLLG